jgi:site-specific DNA-cytosine methylase
MRYRAVDVMGFAGGMTCGVVRSGFELRGKRELPGAFGVANCEANRHILGDRWVTQVGTGESWDPVDVELVFGNPPCSGFSVMSNKKFRGMDSSINDCMWTLVRYAARLKPPMVIFESVRSAYSQGHDLMTRLRAELEERTGQHYDLYHVFHNAAELGGAAIRPRYFWVASAVPFGVEFPTRRAPLLSEVLGDLLDLQDTWEPQPYRKPPSWWSDRARRPDGTVDGHKSVSNPYVTRAVDLLKARAEGWPQGWPIAKVAKAHYEETGTVPESWHRSTWAAKYVANDFQMGFTTMSRWRWNEPGRVVTGGALGLVMHPLEARGLSHREAARIMGFPDDWRILPLRRVGGLAATWGKGITVQCGEWIGSMAQRALDGNPGDFRGVQRGDREWFIDSKQFGRKVTRAVLTPFARVVA